jgi:IS5 family transposase
MIIFLWGEKQMAMDIKAILEKAVQSQERMVIRREEEERDRIRERTLEPERRLLQEQVDKMRYEIAYVCGHENFLFDDTEEGERVG